MMENECKVCNKKQCPKDDDYEDGCALCHGHEPEVVKPEIAISVGAGRVETLYKSDEQGRLLMVCPNCMKEFTTNESAAEFEAVKPKAVKCGRCDKERCTAEVCSDLAHPNGCHGSCLPAEEGKCKCGRDKTSTRDWCGWKDCLFKPRPPTTEKWEEEFFERFGILRHAPTAKWVIDQYEMKEFISSLVQRSYDRGYADGKGEKSL